MAISNDDLSESAAKLLPALEALSAADRYVLGHRLLDGLDEPEEDPAEVKAAWKAELQRRIEEIQSGKVVGIPMEEVFRRSREKYP